MKYLLSILLLVSTITDITSQKSNLNERIVKSASTGIDSFRNIYIDLHQNPELSPMEVKTAAKMAEQLKKLGFEVTTGIGGNGVVGILRNGAGKTIMLRTDMDALPVKENTGLPYASKVVMKDVKGNENPVMHACGLDLPVTNDPVLVMEAVKSMKDILGDKNVIQVDPAMVAEDFGKYGLTEDKVPIGLFWLGGVNTDSYDESLKNMKSLPPLHNPAIAPDFDPTFRTGVIAMSRTIIDLFGNKK